MTKQDSEPRASGIVVGAGPAGRALALELARLGVDVVCVDPRAAQPWCATWGLWADEVERLGLSDAVAMTAPAPRVRFAPGEERELGRAYQVLDAERLRARLSAGLRMRSVRALEVGPDAIRLESGETLRASFVVDARGPSSTSCAQTAVGRVVRARGAPTYLMDFSLQHDDEDARPSFGYLVPLDEQRMLVEETALAAAPPVPEAVLERRLVARLRAHGLEGAVVADAPLERVRIPLDVRIASNPADPRTPGPLLFGVAGGSVHPATGYALARALEDAPVAARAIVAALERGDDATAIARAAHRALWSPGRRLTRALLEHGRDVLLPLDLLGLRAFFRAFFRLAPEGQRAFLSSTSEPGAVALAMAAMWGELPWPLRWRALFGGVRPRLRLLAGGAPRRTAPARGSTTRSR